jgi:Leucine-rich repeat (LRR) protein
MLYLGNNQLSGELPSSLGDLSSLKWLDLGNNQLKKLPSSLGDLSSLESLSLGNNQLSGDIPSSLVTLSSLYYLSLENNQLNGTIPAFGVHSTSLQYIYLQNNRLSGEIPISLVDISSLEQLHLQNNNLIGPIPSFQGRSLWKLLLSNNSLSGPVPKMPTNIQKLICEVQNNLGLCAHKDFRNTCTVGLVPCNMDCIMMNAWLPMMFDYQTCCSQPGISCRNDRIYNLYVNSDSNFL